VAVYKIMELLFFGEIPLNFCLEETAYVNCSHIATTNKKLQIVLLFYLIYENDEQDATV
jgi:hypothetical protein